MKIEGELEAGKAFAVVGHEPVDRQIDFADLQSILILVGDLPHLPNGIVYLGLNHRAKPDQAPGRRHSRAPFRIYRVVPELGSLE